MDLIVGDGVGFAENARDESFDVIIVDSSDPVGPAEKLFSKEFYANAHRILRPGGVMCTQGECLWVHADLIEQMLKENGAPFASAEYASMQVPTYPSGQIGAFLGRKAGGEGSDASCMQPLSRCPLSCGSGWAVPVLPTARSAAWGGQRRRRGGVNTAPNHCSLPTPRPLQCALGTEARVSRPRRTRPLAAAAPRGARLSSSAMWTVGTRTPGGSCRSGPAGRSSE